METKRDLLSGSTGSWRTRRCYRELVARGLGCWRNWHGSGARLNGAKRSGNACRTNSWCALSAIVLFLLPVTVQAQLEGYLKTAAENNPEVKQRYYAYHAALKQVPQARALPDPELSFKYFVSPVETRVGAQQAGISAMQMFPWFGTLGAREDAAAAKAEARFKRFQARKEKVFYEVKDQYYRLYQLEGRIRIHKEEKALLESLKELAFQRYQDGRTGMEDVIRIRMALNELDTRIDKLRARRSPLATEFNLLLHRDKKENIVLPDTLAAVTETDYSSDSLRDHPELQAIDASVQASEKEEDLARLENRPKLGLGATYVNVAERPGMEMPDNGKDIFAPQLTLSIPLYGKKNRSRVQEAEFRSKSLKSNRAATRNRLESNFEEHRKKLENALREDSLYRKQLGEVSQLRSLLREQYTNGEEDFEELLRVEQRLLDYRLKLIRTRAKEHIEKAYLQYLTHSTTI